MDAIAHVVRCFEAEGVAHVAGRVDPAADVETIDTELLLADIDTVERALARAEKGAKAGGREARERESVIRDVARHLGDGRPARTLAPGAPGRAVLRELCLLTAKPVMFVANVGEEDGFGGNPRLETVRAAAAAEDAHVVPICAAIEAELVGLDPEGQREFLADLGLEEPGLDRFVRAGYELLGLRTFFTADPKEARAWTVRAGARRPGGSGQDPQRLRAGVHPRRGRHLRRLRGERRRTGCEGGGGGGGSKAATTSSRKATSSASASTSDPNRPQYWISRYIRHGGFSFCGFAPLSYHRTCEGVATSLRSSSAA